MAGKVQCKGVEFEAVQILPSAIHGLPLHSDSLRVRPGSQQQQRCLGERARGVKSHRARRVEGGGHPSPQVFPLVNLLVGPPLQPLRPAVIEQPGQRISHAGLENVGGMKQEMRHAVMPQSGIEQLRSVFGRAGHHQVLRHQVDLQHVQEPR